MPAIFRNIPLHWPWRSRKSPDQLVISWAGHTLAYVQARARREGGYAIQRMGVERQGNLSNEEFGRHLQTRGLKGARVNVMLRPEQYQLLQIEAPVVAPEELRAAARYQIRDMLDTHVDDITLDIMRVGDGRQKGTSHLFVIVANNATLRQVLDLGQTMNWDVPVIDVQETAQRNLQNVWSQKKNTTGRAQAAIVLNEDKQAVLTISANDELFYSRRLDVPEGMMSGALRLTDAAVPTTSSGFMPVGEYVPDYSVQGAAHGNDYSVAATDTPDGNSSSSSDLERAQRFLVEVQRSLDLWDRTWSTMPLAGVQVYAGENSTGLASWLTRELGQAVEPMNVEALFPGFDQASAQDRAHCWPLLGALLRTESRKL